MAEFDPSKPFTPGGAAFDPSQPFTASQPPQQPAPNNGPLQQYAKNNLMDYQNAQRDGSAGVEGASEKDIAGLAPPKRYADSVLDAFEAGMQTSVSGLIGRKQLPDMVLPENAGTAMRMLFQAGSFLGDAPVMAAGAIGGGIAGSGVPIVGNVAGAAAVAWGLPQAMRRYYMDLLQKGDVKDFGDFFERVGGVMLDGMKGAATGIATEVTGGLASDAMASVGTQAVKAALGAGATMGEAALVSGAASVGQSAAKFATELGVMTTVGKAMDGQVPHAQDFADGALFLAGMHGIAAATHMPIFAENMKIKLQEIYAETGVKPSQVVQEASVDPVLKEQLLSKDKGIPDTYKGAVEPPQKNQELLSEPKPDTQPAVKLPADWTANHPTLSDEFSPEQKVEVTKPETEEAPPEKQEKDESEMTQLEKDNAAIAARRGEGSPPQSSFRDRFNTSINKFIDKWIDQTYSNRVLVRKLNGQEPLSAKDDPVELVTKAQKYGSMTRDMIENGPIDFESGERTGTRGLKDIFSGIGVEGRESFLNYLQAQHSMELMKKGVDIGIPQDAAERVAKAGFDKYDKTAKEYVQWQNDMLKYANDAGILKDGVYDNAVNDYKYYLPSNRILEDGTPGGKKSSTGVVKEIRGNTELLIKDPIEQSLRNAQYIVQFAEQNRAANALVEMAQKSELGRELVKPVSANLRFIKLSDDEVEKFMGENGHTGEPDSFGVFRSFATPLKPGEIQVLENGVPTKYQVGEDVARSYQANAAHLTDGWFKMATTVSKATRVLMTVSPRFLLNHFIRQQETSFIKSDNTLIPFYTALSTMFHPDHREYFNEWIANGGGTQSAVYINQNYAGKDLFNLSKKTGLLDNTRNVIKNPLQLAKYLSDLEEHFHQGVFNAAKVTDYIQSREKGASIQEAVRTSRKADVDTQMSGYSPVSKAISALTPFWRVHVNDTVQTAKAIKDDPARAAQRIALGIMLPSILLWMKNKDDPRYQALQNYEKDMFWIVPHDNWVPTTAEHARMMNYDPGVLRMNGDQLEHNDGALARIPKPFSTGLFFGSGTERLLSDFYQHKPEAFKGFMETFLADVAPVPDPAVIRPALEQFANRDSFTGARIVPENLEKVAPQMQYRPYTSETAKLMGKAIANYVPFVRDIGHGNITLASPLVLEHYVRAWGGNTGSFILSVADKALAMAGVTPPQVKPATQLSDIPFVGSYIAKYPTPGAQPIQDFYDNYEKSQTAISTVRSLGKREGASAANSYLTSYDTQENMIGLNGYAKALGAMNKSLQAIYANPDMKPYEKSQQIESLYNLMIQTAQKGNEKFYEHQKQMGVK